MTSINTNTDGKGRRLGGRKKWAIGVSLVLAGIVGAQTVTYNNNAYQTNLDMIREATVRNDNHDSSAYIDTELDDIVQANHLGPRSEYLGNPGGNPENAFPIVEGGQFRTACEFSHFAYDDPILYPDQPGKAHLHMFFGNTDVNAMTTQDTLEDSGSGTCNGQELNRSGYWSPAMFDGNGNVRVPERIVVYYKGEGMANSGRFPAGGSNPYDRGMRNIAPAPESVAERSTASGGAQGEVNYKCSNNFSAPPENSVNGDGATNAPATGINDIPACHGDHWANKYGATFPTTKMVLEMEIKFYNCFPDGGDVEDWTQWRPAVAGAWFFSNCDGSGGGASNNDKIYPNMSYFVNYVVEPGEDTSDWFLSSDVDPATINTSTPVLLPEGAGAAHHGDVWWSWHPDTNQQWVDNCVNFKNGGTASGCGFGYLTDGGPDGSNPLTGPALKYRPQYTGPTKYATADVFAELCGPLSPGRTFTNDESAGWCTP